MFLFFFYFLSILDKFMAYLCKRCINMSLEVLAFSSSLKIFRVLKMELSVSNAF